MSMFTGDERDRMLELIERTVEQILEERRLTGMRVALDVQIEELVKRRNEVSKDYDGYLNRFYDIETEIMEAAERISEDEAL